MDAYPPFHEQLKYERERRNWSQPDLAKKVGCDTKTISRWENGETLPRSYHRQVLCKLFGKSAETFGFLKGRIGCPDTLNSQPSNVHHRPPLASSDGTAASDQPTPLRSDTIGTPPDVNLYGQEKEHEKLLRLLEDRSHRMVAIVSIDGKVSKTKLIDAFRGYRYLLVLDNLEDVWSLVTGL